MDSSQRFLLMIDEQKCLYVFNNNYFLGLTKRGQCTDFGMFNIFKTGKFQYLELLNFVF